MLGKHAFTCCTSLDAVIAISALMHGSLCDLADEMQDLSADLRNLNRLLSAESNEANR